MPEPSYYYLLITLSVVVVTDSNPAVPHYSPTHFCQEVVGKHRFYVRHAENNMVLYNSFADLNIQEIAYLDNITSETCYIKEGESLKMIVTSQADSDTFDILIDEAAALKNADKIKLSVENGQNTHKCQYLGKINLGSTYAVFACKSSNRSYTSNISTIEITSDEPAELHLTHLKEKKTLDWIFLSFDLKKRCFYPEINSGVMLAQKQVYLAGDNLTLVCPDNSFNFTLRCQENRTWTKIPECPRTDQASQGGITDWWPKIQTACYYGTFAAIFFSVLSTLMYFFTYKRIWNLETDTRSLREIVESIRSKIKTSIKKKEQLQPFERRGTLRKSKLGKRRVLSASKAPTAAV